jgi:hypothetical protein
VREAPRPPSTFERPKSAAARSNNVYADKNGEVYRRTKEGQWQQRSNDRWKTTGGQPAKLPNQPGGTARPSAGKSTGRESVGTSKPSTGATRSAARPDLERDFSARQRGEARVRERSGSPEGRASPPAQKPQTQAAPKTRSTAPAPHARSGDKDKQQ